MKLSGAASEKSGLTSCFWSTTNLTPYSLYFPLSPTGTQMPSVNCPLFDKVGTRAYPFISGSEANSEIWLALFWFLQSQHVQISTFLIPTRRQNKRKISI
jgi:hypothetical protein